MTTRTEAVMVNLWSYRTKDPKRLQLAACFGSGLEGGGATGGEVNDRAILRAAIRADLVLAAWGADGGYAARDLDVVDLLERRAPGVYLRCFGTTKEGHPRHPLYLRRDTPHVPYSPRTRRA